MATKNENAVIVKVLKEFIIEILKNNTERSYTKIHQDITSNKILSDARREHNAFQQLILPVIRL